MILFFKSKPFKIITAFLLVLLLNSLSKCIFLRIDLTEDRRFTLSEITEDFLKNSLSDELHVTLFLDGKVNAGFKRLENATLFMLKQFEAINQKQVSFEHVLLDKIKKEDEKAEFSERLRKLQMTAVNVIDEDNNGKRTEKAVYPWALVAYGERQQAVPLLVNLNGKSGEENLNYSIESLEYRFTEAFRLLSDTSHRRVAFLEGHGEANEEETYDITSALSRYYSVDRGKIGNEQGILDAYAALIVAAPHTSFSEAEKYVIDQYLMNGGKILWLVDGVRMDMDSLTKATTNYGVYNDVGLADMLFRYGVRINPNLLQDVQCALYPVNIAEVGEAARFQPLPWFYSPLLTTNPRHSLTRYVSHVKGEFVSSIDVVGGDENITKTVLLSTSARSKIMPVPIELNLSMSAENVNLDAFSAGHLPVAVLLEGKFSSIFANRMPPKGLGKVEPPLKMSKESKMIVIADGAIIKNGVRSYGQELQIVPLGYDYASNQVLFGNKDFLLNAINYLTDDEGWYTLRQRTLQLRLLDKKEMERRQYYRLLNVGLPLFALLLLFLLVVMLRKKCF